MGSGIMYIADIKVHTSWHNDTMLIELKIGALRFNFQLTDRQRICLLELLARGDGELGLPVEMNDLTLPNKPQFKRGSYFVINAETMAVRKSEL